MTVIFRWQVRLVVAAMKVAMIQGWSTTTLRKPLLPIGSTRLAGAIGARSASSRLNGLNGHSMELISAASKSSLKHENTLPSIPANVHRMVLMRHAESAFNQANIFTGWCDIELTPRGIVEAVEAGEVFRSNGLVFRKCYTSVLTRSIVTAQRALEAAGIAYTPLQYDWRLNERHYGALQGLSKERTAQRLGRTKVMEWRRSYNARPPLMTEEHPHYPIIQEDARYQHIKDPPLGESLEDCQNRVMEAWKEIIQDVVKSEDSQSDYSLVVAHANTLRALVMHLDEIPADEIENLNIPTGIPFYYDVDKNTGQVLLPEDASESGNFRGIYISDERKKRSFLERQRAANDPWLWALHDHQVAKSMLLGDDGDDSSVEVDAEGLEGLEEEAKMNTQLFSSAFAQE